MLTADQHVALLMNIANLQIALVNANGEIAMLKKIIAEQPEPTPGPDGDG